MNKYRKIHIIGAPASGKSYLAKRLSRELGYLRLDLDDIFWDNNAPAYSKKAEPEVRERALEAFLQHDSYVIEGVYHKWVGKSFDGADVVVALNSGVYRRSYRVIKRFIRRKLGLEPGRKETLYRTFKLLRWNWQFDKNQWKEIKSLLKENNNVIFFDSADEAFDYIKNI